MSTWSIGEVARRAGVRPSAIRYYESIGVLPAPPRIGGRRRYTAQILRHLSLVDLAQRAGFRLEEIRTLSAGVGGKAPGKRWRAMAQRKLPEVEALIERAQEMKRMLLLGIECGCVRLEECRLVELPRNGEQGRKKF